MQIIKGKHNEAKVFTDLIDASAYSALLQMCNQEYLSGSKIRIMPDVHAGKGCTIGTTMTIQDRIAPAFVGVDIGCGMLCAKIHQKVVDFNALDRVIREKVPSGFSIRGTEHALVKDIPLEEIRADVDVVRARLSAGSLGGGNHFIEMDRDDDGSLYLVIHSGSRHLGIEVANYYQEAGYDALAGKASLKEEQAQLVRKLKAEGREKEINRAIKKLRTEAGKRQAPLSKELAYVEGTLFRDYLHDMSIAQRFADCNRRTIIDEIVQGMRFDVEESFTTIHNYIDIENMILRKGAVSARRGEKLIIPINMRDGSLICTGKGNDDWNQSAPHGAGRLMSRAEAKKNIEVEDFRNIMQGIYTTCVGTATLDEAPQAYKPIESIVDNIEPTVEINSIIEPVYNFKAGT